MTTTPSPVEALKALLAINEEIVHNVSDRRHGWIGSWTVRPLVLAELTEADKGRTVIYRDFGRAEAGSLSSWNGNRVWARFSTGDTAEACNPADLVIAVQPLDGPVRP